MSDQIMSACSMRNFSKWEKRTLIFSFVIYFIWQINAIFHHGSWGQDFGAHLTWVHMAQSDLIGWLTTFNGTRTNPPLYHFLAGIVFRLTGDHHSLEIFALCCVMVNAIALYLLYQVLSQLVTTQVMRLACMIFLLFIPFGMIQAVVFATDGLATPCFFILLYLFTLLAKPLSLHSFKMIVSSITILLTIALTIKFTFLSLVPAAFFSYLVLYRVGSLSRKRSLCAILVLLIPATWGYFEMHQYRSNVDYNLGISKEWINPIDSPHMNLRSLLMVKRIDSDLLAALPYNYSEDGKTYSLLIPNHYSYPALLHLGMFTDILGVYQYDPKDEYFGPRTAQNQHLMAIAVKTGLLFSICAAIAVPLMILYCVFGVWHRRERFYTIGMITALFSCAFFLNIVLFFPEIPGVYAGGYWLPRLVVPALICFFMLAFAFGDRLITKRYPSVAWLFLICVIFQSMVHLSFLWPWHHNAMTAVLDTNAEPHASAPNPVTNI